MTKMLEENLKAIQAEKNNLEKVYNREQEKVKSSQGIEGQFRVELLKVKSEKNALIANNKSLQIRVDELEREGNKKVDTNKDLQSQLKNKMKVLASLQGRVEGLTNDKDCSELMMTNLVSQVKQLKEELQYQEYCDTCGKNFENRVELRKHMIGEHSTSQEIQCDKTTTSLKNDTVPIQEVGNFEFIEYPCHYCRKTIISLDDLEEHKPVCYTIKEFAPYPCDVCGVQCLQEDDLGRHRTTYHGLGTMTDDFGLVFWCDVCNLTFRSELQLDVHIRGCHEDEVLMIN